jgi:hypothetical protein
MLFPKVDGPGDGGEVGVDADDVVPGLVVVVDPVVARLLCKREEK